MTGSGGMVDLVPVDAGVLEELVAAAVGDADPDDVTPPLGTGWTRERLAWLRAYHQERVAGFAGGGAEETAAIRLDGRIIGGTRLQRTDPADPTEVEWGIWLVKGARGRGIAHRVLALATARAIQSGAQRLVAHTRSTNLPAIGVLQRAGASLHHGPSGTVTARLALGSDAPPAPSLKYAVVERERRFLVRSIPHGVVGTTRITDRYLVGSRLRLRETIDDSGRLVRKLGHKVRLDAGPGAIACTSLYLDDAEWNLLASLPARMLTKTRHHVERDGLAIAVDELPDGTLIAEIDDTDGPPVPVPDWLDVICEVTHDERWTGAALATWS